MYVMVCIKANLENVVSAVSKFLSNLGQSHWDVAKWIFRYLRGTTYYDIIFNRQQSDPLVVGYVDADNTRDLDDKRSTTCYVFTLDGGPICWKSMVQSLVALSTTESKYMAVAKATKEALWLVRLVKELGIQQGGVQLHYDTQSDIFLAKNQVYHARTKHIDVRFHKIKELVYSGKLSLKKIHTFKNAREMLIKPVTT